MALRNFTGCNYSTNFYISKIFEELFFSRIFSRVLLPFLRFFAKDWWSGVWSDISTGGDVISNTRFRKIRMALIVLCPIAGMFGFMIFSYFGISSSGNSILKCVLSKSLFVSYFLLSFFFLIVFVVPFYFLAASMVNRNNLSPLFILIFPGIFYYLLWGCFYLAPGGKEATGIVSINDLHRAVGMIWWPSLFYGIPLCVYYYLKSINSQKLSESK